LSEGLSNARMDARSTSVAIGLDRDRGEFGQSGVQRLIGQPPREHEQPDLAPAIDRQRSPGRAREPYRDPRRLAQMAATARMVGSMASSVRLEVDADDEMLGAGLELTIRSPASSGSVAAA
jgi:hypothetical protein